ncbi:hypothetical protein Goari_015226, partial [Gossypium aridum]|nr:hypothetical protein [Gossypium aridum]
SNFKGVPAAVCSSIEWSYDRLPSEEHKQTFLLCALMGHNALFGDLLMYATGLGLFHGINTVGKTRTRLLTVVSHLKASCLLVDSYSNQRFDMHDLICDVAVSIASKGNHVFAVGPQDVLDDWPDGDIMKSWEMISLQNANISMLPDHLKCPKLVCFEMLSEDYRVKIAANIFREMKNLKVLYLSGMNLSSFPSSISLLANLRTLCLTDCVLSDISLLGELENLEILSLQLSNIEMLPEEIGQLTKLKWLGLSDCSQLKRIPPGVFCKLPRLEELYMANSFKEWEAEGHSSQQSNSSLVELKALSCLIALEIYIPNAKIIPEDFSFEKLQRYIIFIGEASNSEWDWNWSRVRDYSRTLKLSLQTSIRFLNNGVKVLLKKAENLYIDEVKGVEILVHESEVGDYFQQLMNLHIQNGAMIQYIFKDNDNVHQIEFQVESLTLQGLPNLISFCSQNKGSISTSPQGTTLLNQKTLFPKLNELVLKSIGIERIWPPQGFCSTQNLRTLIIKGCANLKHVLSDSMVEYLQQLECLTISECKCIQEIISKEKITKEAFENKGLICFPRLNSFKLKSLQYLIGFCHEDYTVEFPALKILEIKNCPKLKGFIYKSMSNDTSIDGVLFNKKVAFPNLQKIVLSHLRNMKRIWYSQFSSGSFSNLKELIVEHCDVLSNIFSPFLLEDFQKLEKLIITDCVSLEEVFHLQGLNIEEAYVVDSQLRNMTLGRLPTLKHVWNNDFNENISFKYLQHVHVWECWSLKTLFPSSIAKDLRQLESLKVKCCGIEEIVSENVKGSNQQEIWFEFNQLSILKLWNLPNLLHFYPRVHNTTWPVLKNLRTCQCGKLKIFGYGESQLQRPLLFIEMVRTLHLFFKDSSYVLPESPTTS